MPVTTPSDEEILTEGLRRFSPDTKERVGLLSGIEQLPDPEDKDKATQYFLQQYKGQPIICKTPEAIELENKGPQVWLTTLAPHVFRSAFADFHLDYWNWIWPLLLAKRDGKRLVAMDVPLSYLLTLGRGMAKCLDADTLVSKEDGTQERIEDIQIGQRVLSYDYVTGRSVIDVVTNKWPSGRKDCFFLRTKTNKFLTLTAEHRLWSFEGWRRLRDLKVGDRVAVPRRVEQAEVFWDKIVSIEPVGERNTYDIETRMYHNFIANGIVSHNSSMLEWTVIAFGALIGRCLILYVSSTGKLAISHLNNIRDEVEASAIGKYYPAMSEPEVGKHGNKYGWRGDLLSTKSGLTAFAIGLEEEVRGIKKREMRPAGIMLDEFDSKGDSADVTAKKEGIIAGSIFGTQTPDTIIGMAQNLIGPQSVATRTWKRRNELLSYRRESGLIGAFTNDFKIEPDGTRWRATQGRPTWPGLDMFAFQKYLDTSGPIETEAEYQHRFDRNQEEKVMHNYVDKIHVITEEDFEYVYKVRRPPASWNKYTGNDKARTNTEYHTNAAGTLSMSSQNTALPGITFFYDPISFEANAEPDDCAIEMLKCISPRVVYQGVNYEWEELRRILISRAGIERFTGTLQERINAERSGLARIIPKLVSPLLTSQNYVKFRMSHEADDWRAVYRDTFGLPFEAANPGKQGGLALINMAMKIDYTVLDPFGRPDRDDQGQIIYDDITGQPKPLMGMSRWYMIVKKDKLPYPNDAKPDRLRGSDRARYQLTEHRNLAPKANELGEMEREPEKRNDDFTNLLQFFYMDHSIQARPLTEQERAEEALLPHQRQDSIDSETDPERREKNVMSREVALRKQAHEGLVKQFTNGRTGRGFTSYKKLAGKMK